MSPNAAGGVVAGSKPRSTAVHRSPNKLWRSNSIFIQLVLAMRGDVEYVWYPPPPSLNYDENVDEN
jgi:hypothetical protein